jgi:hypothetical protein
MAVLLLTSATGAPGVTTTALGLALTWPRHVLLADCDRDPAQAVQAGYLRGLEHGGRGLVSLAHLHRDGAALGPEVWRQTLPLTQSSEPERRFLPGFTSAGSSRLFEHVWGAVGDALAGLDARGIDVVVDAGRIGVNGLPMGLLAAADAVVLCVRSTLRSLAAAQIHLATLGEQVRALPTTPPVALAVVGPGRPYSAAEISAQFAMPCWREPAWDPRAAEVLSDGADEPRRFHEAGFMSRIRAEAKGLSERMARGRAHTAAVAGVAS